MPYHLLTRSRRVVGAALAAGAVGVFGLTLVAPAQAASCADVQVITVRGTDEPGKYGSVVGDGVVSQVTSKVGSKKSVSGYSLDYPASTAFDSSNIGRENLVAHVKAQAKACPKQTFVLSGYSQGASVVGNALGLSYHGQQAPDPGTVVPSSLAPRVKAVLLFGNPLNLTGADIVKIYDARTKDICRDGDPACDSGGSNILAHTAYKADTPTAAAFAVKFLLAGSVPTIPGPDPKPIATTPPASAPPSPKPTVAPSPTEVPTMDDLIGWIVGMIA